MTPNELVDDISLFRKEFCKDLHIMDVLIEYSFRNDIEIEELGYTLSEHKYFIEMFEDELIKGKYMEDTLNLPKFDEEEF